MYHFFNSLLKRHVLWLLLRQKEFIVFSLLWEKVHILLLVS